MTTSKTRPYPNVIPTPAGTWEARRPSSGRQQHLGTYSTPEAAYRAVLTAQAENLEARAAEYRARAHALEASEQGTP